MKYLLIFLFLPTLNIAFGQETKLDSLVTTIYVDKYVNRDFESLPTDDGIRALEAKYKIRFKSLAACINPLTTQVLGEDEVQVLKGRIEQIAQALFNDGTPILISVGGSNSVQWAKDMNEKGNKYNVTYVSFGNYCVVEKTEREFEKVFNRKISELLGIRDMQ